MKTSKRKRAAPCSGGPRWIMGVAILGTSGLAFGLGGTMLFDGNGGGFEIDSVGTLYSGDGSDSGIANGDDWAQNPNDATFKGVLDDNGDAAFGFNAKRSVDQNWGNQGDGSDASKFNGGSNKNDDLIGAGEEPWMWDGTGGGPQKNDITNTYFHTRVDGNGDRWVIVGAETRSTHGDSHVDFEFLQAGMEVTGGTFDSEGNIIGGAGLLIGQGPAGGRTIDDFSVSVDFLQGGVTPIATVRTWEGANYSAPMDPSSFPNAIFSSTNLGDICHDADGAFPCGASPGTWTHFVSNGGQTSVLGEFQLVEAAINLTELGIDVDVCSTAATFIVKSRSSQSFTAELKDFRLVPFPLEPTPECVVNGPDSVCPGTQDISYTANETTGLSGVTFEWEIMGDATFDDGSNMATGETVTVDADQVCDGSFELWVTVATEFCDNTCHTSVTVDDDEAPTITCPPDVTLECPANTTPGNTGTATCSDNCNCSVSFSDSVAPGCGNTEVITRTWTAEDECGNFNSCDQIITVVDTTAPTITCPPDVTLECPANTTPGNTGTATCSDTCGDCSVDFSDSVVQGCGATGVITRTWTATDDCGNQSSCVQVITVVDTTAPTIICPPDVTLECTADTTPANTGVATCSDGCGTCTVSFSDSSVPGCGNTEVITRTWTAEDECGNFNSCDQIITVVDTTAPTITCPPDVTLECPADTSPNNTGTATCSDTCGGCTVSFSDSSAPGCGNTETITRTWTATDDCDNTATCVQIITVVDTTAPVITSCPSDASIDCETPFTFNVEASDDCGDVTVSCSFTADNPGAVSLVDLGGGRFTITISDTATAVVTCVATDECGNDSAECTFVVSAVCVGEGCTPGFWRQPQHFGHWPAPYTPGTLFSAVFENAFPGKTLLDVVSLGGGGLKALGRHTVAALLNAASGGVDYPLSAADVIAAFNDVFPGSNQEYNALKDLFVELNEAGCPLGGFRGVDDSADSADSADDQNASDPSGKQPAAGDQGTAPAENSVESPSTTMHVVGEGIDVKVVVEDSTEDPAAIEPGRLVGIVINDGLLEPGRFGGSFEVVGNYLQKPEGRLHVELGGIEPIEGYDVLLVHFDAVLHGTLTVSLVDGFVPKAGDTFRVIRAAQVFGEFDTVEMPDLIDVVLTATYDEIGMVLTAAVKPLVGDLNGDGVVDANDLVLLVLDWDQSGSKADLDADGTVGIGDIAAMFMAE